MKELLRYSEVNDLGTRDHLFRILFWDFLGSFMKLVILKKNRTFVMVAAFNLTRGTYRQLNFSFQSGLAKEFFLTVFIEKDQSEAGQELLKF